MKTRLSTVLSICSLALVLHACAADSSDFDGDLVSVYGSQIEALDVASGNFGAIPIRFARASELSASAECSAKAAERARKKIACVRLPNGGLGWVLLSALPGETAASGTN